MLEYWLLGFEPAVSSHNAGKIKVRVATSPLSTACSTEQLATALGTV